MPELTTDLGEISELTMVLCSLSLSDEDGGPVQAVGLGEGVSAACLVPPSVPAAPGELDVPEAAELGEPPLVPVPPDPPPPTVAQTTPASTAIATTTAMSAKSRRRR